MSATTTTPIYDKLVAEFAHQEELAEQKELDRRKNTPAKKPRRFSKR